MSIFNELAFEKNELVQISHFACERILAGDLVDFKGFIKTSFIKENIYR